jgi:hypothetical protein
MRGPLAERPRHTRRPALPLLLMLLTPLPDAERAALLDRLLEEPPPPKPARR